MENCICATKNLPNLVEGPIQDAANIFISVVALIKMRKIRKCRYGLKIENKRCAL